MALGNKITSEDYDSLQDGPVDSRVMANQVPLSDPREIRKLLMEVRFRDSRMDGQYRGRTTINTAGPLINSIMRQSEYAGYSGEDTMTLLAYHALLQNEKLMDIQLDILNTSPAKIVLSP